MSSGSKAQTPQRLSCILVKTAGAIATAALSSSVKGEWDTRIQASVNE
jgi:hypothetical protein